VNRCLLVALGLALVTTAGCQRGEEISTYTTPRQQPPRPPIDYAAFSQQLDRTLAAILPQGQRAWFFKLAAPAPVMDRHRIDFIEFLKTLTAAESDNEPPAWKLPEGWKEREATSEFITTVLTLPDEDGPVELSVSSLELSGEWQDFLTKNVNRWLGQLSQGPLDAATIAQLAQPVSTPAGRATVSELAGVNQKAHGANPHAAMTNPHAGMTTSSPLEPQASSELKYETPKDWQPGRTSAMRAAAFDIVDGEHKAEVTVIALPTSAGPQITDVDANVQRWAGQVGLANLTVADAVEQVAIDGAEGTYVALLGPEDGEQPTGLLAAMVERDGQVWFFKLFGDRSLVESQERTFREFLASVRFP
jgi:hypothetical protein